MREDGDEYKRMEREEKWTVGETYPTYSFPILVLTVIERNACSLFNDTSLSTPELSFLLRMLEEMPDDVF